MDNVKQFETEPQAVPKKKKKNVSLDKKKARYGWFFVAPFLIGFFLIYLPMIFESIQFSFMDTSTIPGGGLAKTWVGLDNYRYAFLENADFTGKLIGSVKDLLFKVPAIVIFSLFMAVLLNQKMKGRALFRAIFFIPVIVSTGIIESIDLQNILASTQSSMASFSEGGSMQTTTNVGTQIISLLDVQEFFSSMKIGQDLVGYVLWVVNEVYSIVEKSGVQMLIFLAGLQSISPAIYESCKMEGASAWETFWKITFPMISPMILVNTIYTVIDSFTAQSNGVMTFINDIYSQSKGMVRATAMSWVYFLVVIVILAIVAGLLSAYVFYQRRD
ncbi:MAG: sugar ABC transporter permease [Clostridia bacterium]|nr:sugar ABC transporter permease [Clostridia bacterium]MBQ6183743.1 sugar ABC transporter permease [Clostridia bacterium]